jgi:hypothetical protein
MKRALLRLAALFLGGGLALMYLPAAKANLVVNGSFDSDLSGWSLTNADFTGWDSSGNPGGSISNGNIGGNAQLSQAIPTVSGGLYEITFQFNNDGSDNDFFSVIFGGNILYSSSPVQLTSDWQDFSFTALASGASSELVFEGFDDPAWWYVDNVYVNQINVQVPGPLPLAATVAAFGWSRRLRRRLVAGRPRLLNHHRRA